MATRDGLRGFVGQRMATKRTRVTLTKIVYKTSGASLVAPPYPTRAEAFLFGGGGSTSGANGGAGGGEAVRVRFPCPPSATLACAIAAAVTGGANGADTTLTLPGGRLVRARGGAGTSSVSGGPGGGFTGAAAADEFHNKGGDGGVTGTATDGATGADGAVGGPSDGSHGGGGGSGGFASTGDLLNGGVGAGQAQAPSYGGGGWFTTDPIGGLLFVVFTRINDS